jgi:SAM-dependent methyltransferase
VSPRLKNPEQVYWGNADTYFEEARLIFEGKAAHHRDPNYLADLTLVGSYKPEGAFLDIGTNMGFFLRHTRNRRWTVTGVEPSPTLSELARRHFGLNVITGFLDDVKFPDESFDIVAMTDVFEHIVDPKAMLREVRRILKPNGIVFVKVPNGLFNLLKLRVLRIIGRSRDFDIFDSYEHVVHYSSKTLETMLVRGGFHVIHQSIARPIQTPVWHEYVGHYYQYPCPWPRDRMRQTARPVLYWLSILEYHLRVRSAGWLAPNIVMLGAKRT